MNWRLDFHKDALKFLEANHIIIEKISAVIVKALKKFRGESVNVNIAKLSGVWTGFYRIRSGKVRIIVEFNFDERKVYIEKIDWRGNAYKP
ncbi:MAG: hypothetical protein AAB646_03135 [Patescibacteria group bacterium]